MHLQPKTKATIGAKKMLGQVIALQHLSSFVLLILGLLEYELRSDKYVFLLESSKTTKDAVLSRCYDS